MFLNTYVCQGALSPKHHRLSRPCWQGSKVTQNRRPILICHSLQAWSLFTRLKVHTPFPNRVHAPLLLLLHQSIILNSSKISSTKPKNPLNQFSRMWTIRLSRTLQIVATIMLRPKLLNPPQHVLLRTQSPGYWEFHPGRRPQQVRVPLRHLKPKTP